MMTTFGLTRSPAGKFVWFALSIRGGILVFVDGVMGPGRGFGIADPTSSGGELLSVLWGVEVVPLDSPRYELLIGLGWEPFAVALVPRTISVPGSSSGVIPWVSMRKSEPQPKKSGIIRLIYIWGCFIWAVVKRGGVFRRTPGLFRAGRLLLGRKLLRETLPPRLLPLLLWIRQLLGSKAQN